MLALLPSQDPGPGAGLCAGDLPRGEATPRVTGLELTEQAVRGKRGRIPGPSRVLIQSLFSVVRDPPEAAVRSTEAEVLTLFEVVHLRHGAVPDVVPRVVGVVLYAA